MSLKFAGELRVMTVINDSADFDTSTEKSQKVER